jgi:nicotinamidase-related amidase
LNIGTFTISNGAVGPANLASITIASSGGGDDSTAFSEVGLFEDTNANSTYDPGTDTRYGTASTAYPTNDGSITFTAAKAIAVSTSVRYFVIVKLNGTTPASPGHTFNSQVTAITTSGGASTAGTPSTVMLGLNILAPVFTFADLALPATQGTAYLGGTDFVMQTFTISYPNGPTNTLTGITVQSSGTGNDMNDYASVKLYRDSNASGSYTVGVDVQVATVGAFSANDGPLTFTLSGAESSFATGSTTRYFIVVAYNMNGANNTTFATQIQSAAGQATGTTISGLPAPTAGPTPGLNLLANNLIATLNGPSTATGIDNNEQGTGGIGVCICDVTLNTIAAAWTVNSITFRSSGTGNDLTAYNYLALHEDSNASGTFDGGDAMAVGVAGTAFAANDGDYVATLTNASFPATTTRRFFLVAKWAGTAVTGENFAARLQSISAIPPSGGQITGAPTANAASFTINAAVLSVANAPTPPASATREGGVAFSHSLVLFRFAATNNTVTINAITLTTTGTADWAADLTGIELYVDNGNGVFDAGIDTLVFTGAATSGTTACTLTSAVNVANGVNQDIWVRLNVAATAGASVPETFIASIANTTDVNVTGGTVAFGSPAPTSNSLGVVTYFVTTFAPTFDLQTGGAAITITGSGFLSPITLTIGGAVCGGTAVIAAGGTQITGLIVPPGTGTGKTIVLTNGAIGPKTLTQTFSYAGGSTIGGSGGGGGGGGGGCEVNGSNSGIWFAALALLALASSIALRKRKA